MSVKEFMPKDENEVVEFAIGELIADVQHSILDLLSERGETQAGLARRLKVSPAAISQLLGSGNNMSIERLAKVYHALGVSVKIDIKSERCDVIWQLVQNIARRKEWADSSSEGHTGSWFEERCSNENTPSKRRTREHLAKKVFEAA